MATRRGMAAWVAGCVLALALVADRGASASPDKMDRQIELFERVLDDVLVESPNWLVQGRHETRGRYRKGEGARFRFDASLVGGRHMFGSNWWKGWWFDDDEHVIIINGDDEDWDDDREKMREKKKEWRARSVKRDERLYGRGKTEIVDAILDYGELLTAVPDGEWLEIEVDLERAELFDEKDLSTLTFKAKMADVRAYGDGKIDEKTMVNRIEVKES